MVEEWDAFEILPWHDAVLREIIVDRRTPGKVDEVLLLVAWPGGGASTIRFSDCYAMNARMKFGVIADESIAGASTDDRDPELLALRARWKPLGVDLDSVGCFRIETSSTGSLIRIYAKRVAVLNDADASQVRARPIAVVRE